MDLKLLGKWKMPFHLKYLFCICVVPETDPASLMPRAFYHETPPPGSENVRQRLKELVVDFQKCFPDAQLHFAIPQDHEHCVLRKTKTGLAQSTALSAEIWGGAAPTRMSVFS